MHRWDTWIHRTGHVVVFANMFLALLLKVDVSGARLRSQREFEIILVATHTCLILAVVVEAVLTGCSYKLQREEPTPWPRSPTMFPGSRLASLVDCDPSPTNSLTVASADESVTTKVASSLWKLFDEAARFLVSIGTSGECYRWCATSKRATSYCVLMDITTTSVCLCCWLAILL